MYVCLCKGITDHDLRAAAERRPEADARRICRDLGVAMECGRCARTALNLVHETQQQVQIRYAERAAGLNVVHMLPLAS